jgi:hypothetical protein
MQRMPYRTNDQPQPDALDGDVARFSERMRRARRGRRTVALVAVAFAGGVSVVPLAMPQHAPVVAPAPRYGRVPVNAVAVGPWDCPAELEDPTSEAARAKRFARDVYEIDCSRTWW